MAWGKNGTPDTLASASDELSIADLTENKFNMLMSHEIYSGVAQGDLNFNNDKAGNDYATRSSKNGAADSTETSANRLIYMADNASGTADFEIGYLFDIASEEKFIIGFFNNQNTAGAGYAPSRREMVGKYDETASRITRIDIDNVGAGDFDTGSNLSVLGSEITPAAAIPFAENAQVGSRAEITDTRKMYDYGDHPTFEDNTFSSGWTSTDSTNVNTNTTTKVIDANVPSTGAQTGVLTYPLGYTLENNFVLEFKMEITSYTDNTDNTHQEIYIGMTNNTSAYNVSQQFIGMSISNAGTGGGNDRYALQEFYNEALTANNGQGDSTNRPNANDIRYHRISKSGSTLTYSIYSDSSYSTLVETISGTATDTYSLNTISVKLRALDGTQNGVLTVEIDDIKIYNGVDTPSNSWKEIGT